METYYCIHQLIHIAVDTRVAHTFALTVNLDFQSQARYNHDTIGDHEKMMVIGQLVQIIFWKETDRQTDTTDHFTFPLTRSVMLLRQPNVTLLRHCYSVAACTIDRVASPARTIASEL